MVVARPVVMLRELATKLEAAIVVCLAEASGSAVHEVRRLSRKMEAQMGLLERVGTRLPEKQMRKVAKQLKKLRRAAGLVRDLDVQEEMVASLAEKHRGERESAKELGERLKRKRGRAAEKLLRLLEKRQRKVALAIEAMMEALEAHASASVGVEALLAAADREFRESVERAGGEASEDDRLHGVRKAAKVARYQAESVEGSARAKEEAKRYQKMQKAGGSWHDWMEMSGVVGEALGKGHAMTRDAERREVVGRGRFRRLIGEGD